jgi:hypothetical protein
VAGIVLLAVVAGGVAWWMYAAGKASEREAAAKAELTELGALMAMDSQREHVNSVNFATLKSPDTLDRAVELLPALGQLKSLNVQGTQFGDKHAAIVGQLGSLQDLALSSTQITDSGLEKLVGLSRLNAMYLVDTPVTNAGLPALAQLDSLKILDLSQTKVTGNFGAFRELPQLQHLLVQKLTLDAAAIAAIGQIPNLSRLTLWEATYPEEALSQLEQKKPNLAIDR